ncbi:MAG: metal transporter, partial [Gemmatimonadetes bacterium]|nr:metal transporter [Gemmatimonadota bacterium]
MTLLLASIAALGLGPLAYRFADRRNILLGVLDGFVFVAIGGLVILTVLPEAVMQGGWPAIGFVVVGF